MPKTSQTLLRLVAACALLVTAVAAHPAAQADTVRLRVTQRDLVPLCLDGTEVPSGSRSWNVKPGPVSLVVSMRNAERRGVTPPDPGAAAIAFTAESGHRYEVEVRADPSAFSSRSWRAGEWTPVVRDRTVDRVVSEAPRWQTPACR